MKISSYKVAVAELRSDNPVHNPPDRLRTCVVLRITTADGIDGYGITFYGGAMTSAPHSAVDALCNLIVGDDPLRVERVAAKLGELAGSAGPPGLFLLALSGIDLALWDIRCKALGMPLWTLAGGAQETVPAYASTMLRRGDSLDQLARTTDAIMADGYRELKMQLALVGDTNPRREIACAETIRQIVGPNVRLMCDINQRWRPEEAIDLGRRLEHVGFAWLEDVTLCDDYDGLARVTAALSTPICGGEAVYGIAPFKEMLARHSVDIAMIDLWRVGGITQWLKVAGMAQAFNIPVVSHLFTEVHVNLIAGVPNGLTVECSPWMNGLFEEPARPVRGRLTPSRIPGIGFAFTREVRARLDR